MKSALVAEAVPNVGKFYISVIEITQKAQITSIGMNFAYQLYSYFAAVSWIFSSRPFPETPS
jgi:hypothetical protein